MRCQGIGRQRVRRSGAGDRAGARGNPLRGSECVSYDPIDPIAPAATHWRNGEPVYDRGEAVCVVGGGASGLAAIKNLKQYGFQVDCYERETGVGGAWNWRHDRSPVYASTHLVSSKPFTQF